MSELKPCANCAGEATRQAPNMHRKTCIACKECGMSTGWGTVEEVTATWNRRAQPANEPLTLDELKQMDGEPVYIVTLENQLENPPYWAIVGISKNDSRYQGGVTLYNKTQGDWGSIELYGKTWLAYRRPPERSENE